MGARKLSREDLAREALALAVRSAWAEARRLRISEHVLDPEIVAGLAVCQWLRCPGRIRTRSYLHIIVRRRLVDELRRVTGFRKAWGCRHAINSISLDQLQDEPGEHPFDLPARFRGADRHTCYRVVEVLGLPLTEQERTACELLLLYAGQRRKVWGAMRISESRLVQVLRGIRMKALAAEHGN